MSMNGVKVFAYDIEVIDSNNVTFYYNYINDGKELEVVGVSACKNLVIPEEATYMNRTRKVTSIGKQAFANNTYITSVTIPNSVTIVETGAFQNCDNLTSVSIGKGVKILNGSVFWHCTALTTVYFGSSIEIVCGGTFNGCNNLASIHITDLAAWCKCSFWEIDANPLCNGGCLYLNNTKITDLVVPDGVEWIGGYSFYGYTSLTSVTFPNSVTRIGSAAFWNCNNLSNISFGNNICEIGELSFSNCIALTSLTIPKSVTTIRNRAFEGIILTTIISKIETPFEITGKSENKRTFAQDTYNNATLYVPKGTIDKYKATNGWKDFLFIEEGTPTNIHNIEGDKTNEIQRYTLDGRIIKNSSKGINIIQMKNGKTKKVLVK